MEETKGPLITEFIDAASHYCHLMEQASKKRTGELFNDLHQLLPEIYLKASRLPKPRYCFEEEPKRFVREDDYARIHDALQQKIELVNGIARMSPGVRHDERVLLSFTMAETYADIYEELKNFIKLYEVDIPQAMNDAVWICRNSYEQGLGLKLIEGIKLLHTALFNQHTEGSRAVKSDDFSQEVDKEEDKPWHSDDQEEVYGEDE